MTTASHTIPASTTQPTVQESYNKLVADGVIKDDKAAAAAPTESIAAAQPEGTQERPEWLPKQFKTPEDLAKSYAELRAKMDAREAPKAKDGESQPATDEIAEEAVAKAGLDMDALEAEFSEKGELSEASYKALQDAGISKEMVDSYVAGQIAQVQLYENGVTSLVGGPDAYGKMIEWASKNLSDDEITEYDSAVNSFDMKKASFAVKALKARMEAADGVAPTIQIDGKAPTGIQGYQSTAQMQEDMRDPRYKSDPAFRQAVYAKIARMK